MFPGSSSQMRNVQHGVDLRRGSGTLLRYTLLVALLGYWLDHLSVCFTLLSSALTDAGLVASPDTGTESPWCQYRGRRSL